MYKLYIFDLDGTILNTLEDLAASTNAALQKHGFAERGIDEVRRFVGNGIGKLIERAVPEGTDAEVTAQVLEDFKAHYGEHCADRTRPYDGVIQVIESLRVWGVMTAVVSNKADFAVQELCRDYFPGLFDFVVGERENIRRKPCPDSANEVLRTLGVDKTEALYIGDSDVDIETAKNAGLDCVSVSWGFRDTDFLLAHGASVIIDQPNELLRFGPAADEVKEEYWDIYDAKKQKTGRRMKRNDWCLEDDEYHLTVLGVVRHADGRFLITQRVMTKQWAPGWWEVSGGAAMAGEDSMDAVLREVREETGLDVSGWQGGYQFTYHRENPGKGDNYFVDVYRFTGDFTEEDVHVQTEEAGGFKLATAEEIRALADQGIFLHYDSIRKVFEDQSDKIYQ